MSEENEDQRAAPMCQSCSRPMIEPKDFGSEENGEKSAEYCSCCRLGGRWVEPAITMEQLVERCVRIWTENETASELDSSAYFSELFPRLKRWRKE